MKRTTLIVTICFLAFSGYSQRVVRPGIGVNFTDFSKNVDGDAKAKVGWQIGVSASFGKKWYWEPGIYYVAKSTEVASNTTADNFDASIEGIRIPLALGWNIFGDTKTGIAIHALGGASVFFVTSADELEKDNLNKTQWGVFAGAGVDFWKLFLDATYEWSLTDTQKDNSGMDIGRTRTLFITAGFRLNLGSESQ